MKTGVKVFAVLCWMTAGPGFLLLHVIIALAAIFSLWAQTPLLFPFYNNRYTNSMNIKERSRYLVTACRPLSFGCFGYVSIKICCDVGLLRTTIVSLTCKINATFGVPRLVLLFGGRVWISC